MVVRRARSRLSAAEARRLALGAQGFADPRPSGRVDRRHLRRVLDRIGLIQIDAVNVLVRSQELPLFARLGPHPRSLIWDATRDGELFEYWVHEACHVPVDQYPLYRWAMEHHPRWKGFRAFAAEHRDFVDAVLERVRAEGPVVASDIEQRERPKEPWWDWNDGKRALEHLFRHGEIAVTRRPTDFARVYDLAERVIPLEHRSVPHPDAHTAKKELLLLAAKYHGVGTAKDLADYHRLTHVGAALRELVDEERLVAVDVEGWRQPAFLHPDATIPRRVRARALLSPFDPVVWHRDRAERIWDFFYRIEIYVPAPQRQYGYYVLPFLLGDRFVGRVDLKADRATGTLRAQATWAEPGVDRREVAHELAAELRLMADWLELDEVHVADRGDLAAELSHAITAAGVTRRRS
jgi:uncharacterized protein YcaQ